MEKKKYCPECGHEFKQGESDYNHETGDTLYSCPECHWECVEPVDRDRIREDLEKELAGRYETEDRYVDSVIEKMKTDRYAYRDALYFVIWDEIRCQDISDKLEIYGGPYDENTLKEEGLVVVAWPESQSIIERDRYWEHARLINDETGLSLYGSSAYAVEREWYERNW